MHVAYVHSDSKHEYNSGEWRVTLPYLALQRSRRHRAVIVTLPEFADCHPITVRLIEPADVLVIQRNAVGEILPAIQYWRSRGKTVVVDVDDAYEHLDPTNAAWRFWLNGEHGGRKIDPLPVVQLRQAMSMASGVTAPAPWLVNDYAAHNARLLPNYTDTSLYRMREPRNDGEVRVL